MPRASRAVRVAETPEEADENRRQLVAEIGLRQKGAGLAPAEHAAADDEVALAAGDGSDEEADLLRVVAVVGVEEDDDVDLALEACDSSQARGPVTAAFFADDARAGEPGDIGGGVARCVVDDDDLRDLAARQIA
jgi:hypothetical protein